MSRKYPKNLIDPDFDTKAYSNDLIKALMSEFFKIVESEQRAYGKEFAHNIVINYLASYVSTIVFNSLRSGAQALTPEMRLQLTSQLFLEMKRDIEDAISQGFASAFQSFDPESSPDYQCDIICLDTGYSDGPTN